MKPLHFLTCLSLVGCAGMAYQPPATGLTAPLGFELDNGGASVPPAAVIFAEARTCRQAQDVVVADVGHGRFRASAALPVDQEVSLMMASFPECHVLATFTPVLGQRYVAVFELNRAKGRCQGGVFRYEGMALAREPTARFRTFTKPFGPGGEFCVADTRSPAPSPPPSPG